MTTNILIIDSNDDFSLTLGEKLSSLSYRVVYKTSLESGLEEIENQLVHLVILGQLSGEIKLHDAQEAIIQRVPNVSLILVKDVEEKHLFPSRPGSFIVLNRGDSVDSLAESIHEIAKFVCLQRENNRLQLLIPLYRSTQEFFSASSEIEVYQILVKIVASELNIPRVSMMVYDEEDDTLKIVASVGIAKEVVENVQLKPGEKIAGLVFKSKKTIVLNKGSKHVEPYTEMLHNHELSAAISFPVKAEEKVAGVLNISTTKDGSWFSQSDIELLSIISEQAFAAIKNIELVKEKEDNLRLKDVLSQYVSPEAIEVILNNKNELQELGEVKNLTVLFADIRNFTTLIQELSSEDIRLFLNNFFEMFTFAVLERQGMIDKFMGDAALVVFGAPVTLDDSCGAAVESAVKIKKEFYKLKKSWQKKYSIFNEIDLGIGISTGRMFLGNIGSPKRFDYTVIGTDVNIAQRLACENSPGKIFVTDSVKSNLNSKYTLIAEPSITLRGFDIEKTIYALT